VKRQLARKAVRVRVDPALFAFDVVLIATAYLAVLVLRFDGDVPPGWQSSFGEFLLGAIAIQITANWAWGLYRQMWRHASIREAQRILEAGLTAGLGVLVLYVATDHLVPLSVAVLGWFVATSLIGALRFQSRLLAFHRHTGSPSGLRVVIVGAGEAGAVIVREMQRTPMSGLVPVAFVDDDPHKIGLLLHGVPVVGSSSELVSTVQRFDAHRVILAVTGASHGLVTRVATAAETAEVPLQILPGFGEVMRDRVSLHSIRDVRIEDLIGRDVVKIDLDAVGQLLYRRRVLITGGGGSIGSEIARQVANCAPAELVLLDHDETHLHDTAATIGSPTVCVLADIRDASRVRQVFRTHRPEIVFHAAAHKHVPLLETQACEAIDTNVSGTLAVVEAAEDCETERLVFISTDKAVRPASVMGASKWMGEQIVLSGSDGDRTFCAVRFGNVLGSRGSVIPTFMRQIESGGPVTVTDPRMTRYFMTIEEAVQLVLQAAVYSNGGEVFMLEMGRAVNILDLAKRMIRLAGLRPGVDLDIELVGIRPGEKLAEQLADPMETQHPTEHPSIVRLEPQSLPRDDVHRRIGALRRHFEPRDDRAAARALMDTTRDRDEIVIDLVAEEERERLRPSV
jgi:FlaA1/EpsC-like NDP-sugar epimerase